MRLHALGSLVLVLGLARFGVGQAIAPPDVNKLSHEMAERVRHLGEDISSDLAQTPAGRHLIQDTRELAQTVDEFHESLHGNRDPIQVRRAFQGIEATWQHLREQLTRPGVSSPAVGRAAGHVDQLVAQLREGLGLNTPPPGPGGTAPLPPGPIPPDVNKLSHEMAERVRHLGEDISSDLAQTPAGRHLIQDTRELAQTVDEFHESLHGNRDPIQVRRAFQGIEATWQHLREQLTRPGVSSPAVGRAAGHVDQLVAQLRQSLGLTVPPPAGPMPPPGEGPPPIVALSDQLAEQTDAFVQVFGPTAGAVPEGGLILTDAQRLQGAAADFRQAVARGLNPGQLVAGFRNVDICWQRLARRINRIARGRTGPNIEQVGRIGAICEQIQRTLGMPAYPATYGAPR